MPYSKKAEAVMAWRESVGISFVKTADGWQKNPARIYACVQYFVYNEFAMSTFQRFSSARDNNLRSEVEPMLETIPLGYIRVSNWNGMPLLIKINDMMPSAPFSDAQREFMTEATPCHR